MDTAAASEPPTFVIVEDHREMASALARQVAMHAPVELASSIARSRPLLAKHNLAGVILDENLVDGSGLGLLSELRGKGWTVPVLVITGERDYEIANRAQLLQAELAFKPNIGPNVRAFCQRCVEESALPLARKLAVASTMATERRLSARERDTLMHLARDTPRDELAATMGLGENTVKSLVRRILFKLELPNTNAVRRAILDRALHAATN